MILVTSNYTPPGSTVSPNDDTAATSPCRYGIPTSINVTGNVPTATPSLPINYSGCEVCRNLTALLLGKSDATSGARDDSRNAFLYIVFVLLLYACSIAILMVKYIRKEREGTRLEDYYEEFVKRERFQNLVFYDKQGRPIQHVITYPSATMISGNSQTTLNNGSSNGPSTMKGKITAV